MPQHLAKHLPQYTFRLSKRAKRLQIKINRLAQVEVVSPIGVTQADVDHFVKSNVDWIKRHQKKILSRHDPSHSKSGTVALPTEIHFPLLNKTYQVRYLAIEKRSKFSVDASIVYIHSDNDDEKKLLLRKFIHKMAKQVLTTQLDNISAKLKLPYNRVFIKAQKTRWGSCSSKKNINLNRNLLFLTPVQVEYLIIHELCHTVHLNHSSAYWGLVAEIMPTYKKIDQSLKHATDKVPHWALV